jgi:hypothetical protein
MGLDMTVPKIVFKYSGPYDRKWKEWMKVREETPSSEMIQEYIKLVENIWKKDGNKVLTELSVVTGLQWKTDIMFCYIVGKCNPFSDPLTLPMYEGMPDYFVDVMINELIRKLLFQNFKKSKKAWDYVDRRFSVESSTTKIYTMVNAIHTHIYRKFFDDKRFKRDVKMSRNADYKKAWTIVMRDGYEDIIYSFKRRIAKT